MKKHWMVRLGRCGILAASGSMVLGTSCAQDVREAMISGGLDFVESSAVTVLESFFPLDAFVAPE